MHLNRTVVATVVLAVLLGAVAPAVQAVPLAKPQPSQRLVAGDWLSTAVTWLSHLFNDRAPQAPASQQKGSTTTTKPPTGTGTTVFGGGGNFAGSCIDPNGNPNGCFDGGGGG